MDTESIRNTLGLIGLVGFFVWMPLRFNRISKRAEYAALLDSGQKVNLNLFTLIRGYFRPKTDPLRPAHTKLARIGFAHFAMMLLGMIFVPTLIFILFSYFKGA